MNHRDYLRRYLLLILVLIICAGVAWYLTSASGVPADDAVLAKYPVSETETDLVEPEDSMTVRMCDPDVFLEKTAKRCSLNGT